MRAYVLIILLFAGILEVVSQESIAVEAAGLDYVFPYNQQLRQQPPQAATFDSNGFLWLLNEDAVFLFKNSGFYLAHEANKSERFMEFGRVEQNLVIRSSTRSFYAMTGAGCNEGDFIPAQIPGHFRESSKGVNISSPTGKHIELQLPGFLVVIDQQDTTLVDLVEPKGEGLFSVEIDSSSFLLLDQEEGIWVMGTNGMTLRLMENTVLNAKFFPDDIGVVKHVHEEKERDRTVVLSGEGIFVHNADHTQRYAHFETDDRGVRINPFELVKSRNRLFIYALDGFYELHLDELKLELLIDPRKAGLTARRHKQFNFLVKSVKDEMLFLGSKDNDIIAFDPKTDQYMVYPILPLSDERKFNLIFEITFFSNGDALILGEAGLFFMDGASRTFSKAKERWPNLEWNPWFNPSGLQLLHDTLLFVPAFNGNMLIHNLSKDSVYVPENIGDRVFHISDAFWDRHDEVYSTGKGGLIIYHIPSNTVRVMNTGHGLDNESQYYRYMNYSGRGDEMFLGGQSSFFSFSAQRQRSRQPTRFFLADLRVSGSPTSHPIYSLPELDVQMNQEQQNIRFQCIHSQYAPRPIFDFQGRSNASDGLWASITAGEDVVFSSLAPGKYQYQMKGEDDQVIDLIRFTVAKPFLERDWVKYTGLFSLLIGLFALYRYKIQSVRKHEQLKHDYDQQIKDLEMRSLRQQMDPHFIFNSLNSIKSYIAENEQRIAIDYLNKFAQLIRLILNNSSRSSVDLKSELKALELFIELEQLRFDGSFEYRIIVDETIDTEDTFIPPLIFQPYAENAIWHGLMQKQGERKLQINLQLDQNILSTRIRDNGIGRELAAIRNKNRARQHRSLGMQITEERIRKGDEHHAGSVSVTDLKDTNNEPIGTEVLIELPV